LKRHELKPVPEVIYGSKAPYEALMKVVMWLF
jgi:hypothetical protein